MFRSKGILIFRNVDMLIRKDYFIFMVILFCMANPAVAGKANSELTKELSPEVIAAMEGNQKTIDSVHTLQAIITKNSAHDYGEKGSRQLMEKLNIWYDGDNFRQDVLESKFTGEDTEPLSLGEVEGEEGGHSYFAPPPIGEVEIYTTKSKIYYNPPTEYVGILPSEKDKSEIIRENDILRYQSARGSTLKENVLASAKNGFYFSAQSDTVDGENCVLLMCDYTNPDSTLKIWVVPSKGHCIKKLQDIYKDKVANEYTTTLKKYPPDIWWFDTVKAGKPRQIDVIRSFEISVNSLIFNEPIDPNIFTVWGIDVTPKTRVNDKIQGIIYTLATDETEVSQAGEDNIIADTTDSSNTTIVIVLGIITLIIFVVLGMLIKGRIFLLRK